jgi:hypothetical protein
MLSVVGLDCQIIVQCGVQTRHQRQVEFWQRLGDLPLAVFTGAVASVWRSGDPGEDYDRYLIEAGLEVFW